MNDIFTIYDPDGVYDYLLSTLNDDREIERDRPTTEHPLPPCTFPIGTTESELLKLSDEVDRIIEVNSAAVCALLPQDDYPDAAVLRIHPTAILGGEKVMCTYEVSNVGEMYPDSIINCAFCSATVIPEYK